MGRPPLKKIPVLRKKWARDPEKPNHYFVVDPSSVYLPEQFAKAVKELVEKGATADELYKFIRLTLLVGKLGYMPYDMIMQTVKKICGEEEQTEEEINARILQLVGAQDK